MNGDVQIIVMTS